MHHSKQSANQKELPIGIRLGSSKGIDIRHNLAEKGVLFQLYNQNEGSVYSQLQQIALDLILTLKPELVRISIVNMGLNNDFKYLRRLNRIVKQINFIENEDSLNDLINDTIENIKSIYNSILCESTEKRSAKIK